MRSSKLIERLKVRRVAVAAALAIALFASFAPASPAGAMYIDPNPGPGAPSKCPPGYACVYEGLIIVGNPTPEHKYYYYGSYNFVNEYGNHVVRNNQTGGARVLLCLGYNGTNCTVNLPPGHSAHGSLTPFNSIKLIP